MTPGHSGPASAAWPALPEARRDAARRGALSIGTQHVVFAVLAGHDDVALDALRAAGVDPDTAADALQAIVGIGRAPEPTNAANLPVSARVEAILDDAARAPAGHRDPSTDQHTTDEHTTDGCDTDRRTTVRDRDVLRALLTSQDPAVGHLMLSIVSNPQKVLYALHSPDRT